MGSTILTALLFALAGWGVYFLTKSDGKRLSIQRKLGSLPDFKPIVSSIQPALTSALALDPDRKKLAVLRSSGASESEWRMSVYSFDDLVAVELVKDDISITKTQRGSQVAGAVIGGALLGPAGLIVGGLSGSTKQENMIGKLAIKIYVKDLLAPVQEIVFLHVPNGGIPPHLAQPAIFETEQWHGRLKVILEG